MSERLKNAISKKELQMRLQGKKGYSSIRALDRQRRIGIKPCNRSNTKTFL